MGDLILPFMKKCLFIVLFFFFLKVSSIIFPSIQTSVCTQNTDDCILSIVLLVTIDNEGSAWSSDIVFG